MQTSDKAASCVATDRPTDLDGQIDMNRLFPLRLASWKLLLTLLVALLSFGATSTGYRLNVEINDASVDRFADSTSEIRIVKCEQDLLTILTPVYPDKATLSLLRNQLKTFATFADIGSFAAWLLVVPADKAPALTAFLDDELSALPRALDDLITVVYDEVCVPEFEDQRWKDLVFENTQFISGWLKQQVLKLGCGHVVKTPYYLITDADTFFLNPFGAGDIMERGRCDRSSNIVCNPSKTRGFRAKVDMHAYANGTLPTGKAQWIYNTASYLKLDVPKDTVVDSIGVTPQTMSTAISSALADHIRILLKTEVWEAMTWRSFLILAFADYFLLPKDQQLDGNTPWTEYNAYWLYGLQSGLWDRYHVRAELQSVDANAWTTQAFSDWDPCAVSPDKRNLRLWGTVQSVVVVKGKPISGDAVWKKLRRCVPDWQTMIPAVRTTRHGCVPT